MGKNNQLELHDSILRKVDINPTKSIITFELDHIIGLFDTEEINVFKPVRKKAILKIINYNKADFSFCYDKNNEIILDFELYEDSKDKTGRFQFHIYTSNNSSIKINCEKYSFRILNKETPDQTLIVIPK